MREKNSSKLKIGVISNEFFDSKNGRVGGFGWAARELARFFVSHPEKGVEIVYVACQGYGDEDTQNLRVHGCRLITGYGSHLDLLRRMRSEKFDLLLTIDYRPNYRKVLMALPRTPVIVWVRDPRPPSDEERILSVRLPGKPDLLPAGLNTPQCDSMKQVALFSKLLRRPLMFSVTCDFLLSKVAPTYRCTPKRIYKLPNIINIKPPSLEKSETPKVLFLARLDPYKRPWLWAELAKSFPDVEFATLGKPHFEGEKAWKPENLAPNIKLLGHLDASEKIAAIASSWVLVNTSIHEGLAVSFLEALKCETPILSCVNPDDVVSRFGRFTGMFEGSGMEHLDRFKEGLRELLDDEPLRRRLGKEGREWVVKEHSEESFWAAFQDLLPIAKIRKS